MASNRLREAGAKRAVLLFDRRWREDGAIFELPEIAKDAECIEATE